MDKTLIMVSSVTYAIKGRDLLRNHGIKAYIERTPNASDRVGCGYSIMIFGNISAALQLLKSAGIKVLGTV
ncbi:MAG: DUF3343 domain-containing protein [Oscillospiraceae bacterium]|jgi:hypothetical protein|nr:DUF3343 domain-containing protein [Oscillospiraceae bacterium]